jgi:hypothetical protein
MSKPETSGVLSRACGCHSTYSGVLVVKKIKCARGKARGEDETLSNSVSRRREFRAVVNGIEIVAVPRVEMKISWNSVYSPPYVFMAWWLIYQRENVDKPPP